MKMFVRKQSLRMNKLALNVKTKSKSFRNNSRRFKNCTFSHPLPITSRQSFTHHFSHQKLIILNKTEIAAIILDKIY